DGLNALEHYTSLLVLVLYYFVALLVFGLCLMQLVGFIINWCRYCAGLYQSQGVAGGRIRICPEPNLSLSICLIGKLYGPVRRRLIARRLRRPPAFARCGGLQHPVQRAWLEFRSRIGYCILCKCTARFIEQILVAGKVRAI